MSEVYFLERLYLQFIKNKDLNKVEFLNVVKEFLDIKSEKELDEFVKKHNLKNYSRPFEEKKEKIAFLLSEEMFKIRDKILCKKSF